MCIRDRDKGVLGIDPTDEAVVAELTELGVRDRIIPEAVVACIMEGKPWYKIKFNNEVDLSLIHICTQNVRQLSKRKERGNLHQRIESLQTDFQKQQTGRVTIW